MKNNRPYIHCTSELTEEQKKIVMEISKMAQNQSKLSDLIKRANNLTGGVEVDLDKPLDDIE